MTLKALIVDDEPLAIAGLRMLLAEDPEIATIDEAVDGYEAVVSIQKRQPDLVFLDVQMPEMDGFGVVEAVGAERMPAVIFVTAHDRHAIRAFDINAVDYLLKPVTRERFTSTLKRAKSRVGRASPEDARRQVLSLLETMAPQRYLKRFAMKSAGTTTFLSAEDVDWIQAADNYVELHAGRSSHLLHAAMGVLEKTLDPNVFLRIHRSLIVNVHRIKAVQTASYGEYVVVLQNGLRLQSSRGYAQKIRSLTENPF